MAIHTRPVQHQLNKNSCRDASEIHKNPTPDFIKISLGTDGDLKRENQFYSQN